MRSRALLIPLLLLTGVSPVACARESPATWGDPPAPVAASAAAEPAPAGNEAEAEPGAAASVPADQEPPRTRPKATQNPKPKTRTQKPATVRPKLPAGRVPDFLVGRWTGGPGSQDGYYLEITAGGRYERGREPNSVQSTGVVVADESRAVFHDRDGGAESAGLTYTDAAGIVVLSVNYSELGYYSYVTG